MDPEDYPSDSDASDEDFRPDKEDSDSASEVDSDEGHNAKGSDEDDDETAAGKKRKRKIKKAGKKKSKTETTLCPKEKESAEKEALDEEDEERLTDALWANFLAGSGSSNGSASTTANKPTPIKKDLPKPKTTSESKKPAEPVQTTTVTKIFEFAGEAVEVTEEISKDDIPQQAGRMALGASNGNSGPPKSLPGRSSGGGLGAVLNQIGKKNKLSTLEKTKLDWNSFKRSQGIEEELQTHNKGKDGYLERQDFLQRADVRQFEIEKSFRQTTRSNR